MCLWYSALLFCKIQDCIKRNLQRLVFYSRKHNLWWACNLFSLNFGVVTESSHLWFQLPPSDKGPWSILLKGAFQVLLSQEALWWSKTIVILRQLASIIRLHMRGKSTLVFLTNGLVKGKGCCILCLRAQRCMWLHLGQLLLRSGLTLFSFVTNVVTTQPGGSN